MGRTFLRNAEKRTHGFQRSDISILWMHMLFIKKESLVNQDTCVHQQCRPQKSLQLLHNSFFLQLPH